MQDIFNSASFKFLFNLPWGKTVRYNSISERLSVINPEFFRQAYELIFSVFSEYYSQQEMEQRLLIRVDSTMVAEAAAKLKEGIEVGPKPIKSKASYRKQIKYTFAFDGLLPCTGEVFTRKTYTSESVAVPEVIYRYAEKSKGAVFVFDRGMRSRQVMNRLTQSETPFVTRIQSNSRYTVERVIEKGGGRIVGILELESDMQVRLPYRKSFLENSYRLIIAKNPQTGSVYYFLTNMFDMDAEQIVEYYKKRWDIEVFFRFLKQELNLSHITSTSENGMHVMLYMTMIASMLVLVYKRLNQIGYKTAVRRIAFELNEYIIKLIVNYCGGDPNLVFR
jgi:transposase